MSVEAWTPTSNSADGREPAGRGSARGTVTANAPAERADDGYHPHVRNGPALAAISRRVVALLKQYAGKGPVKARTYYWGDLLVVMLSGGYTTLEQTLLSDGLSQPVVEQRAHFHEAMRSRFTSIVEHELNRDVLACMDASHYGPDYNAKVFVLAPVETPVEKSASDNGKSA